jgi:ABC-type multidrug transport system permease subunit
MIFRLLIKDLLRMWRNPWPTLIFIAIPLLLTGLLGMVFGPKSSGSGGLQPIQLAVVDEDKSVLSDFLRGSGGQSEAQEFIQPRFVERAEAERLLNDNKVSAMLVIPKGFTREFLRGNSPPALKLVKNPAQSFHPAIVEELMGVVAEALSGLSSVFQPELPRWRAFFEESEERDTFDFQGLAKLIESTGERIESAREFVYPPLVSYGEETRETEPSANGESSSADSMRAEVFSYILPAMSALFLFMIGDGATRDLYKELRLHTLDRYRTFRPSLRPLVLGKLLYALLVMLGGALILFGSGHWVFGIEWRNVPILALLIVSFCLCAGGIMSILAALARVEKRADVINSLLVFGLAFVGGSMVPVQVLPAFIRNYISPLTPNYWLIGGIQQLQDGASGASMAGVIAGLAVSGLGLTALAAWRFDSVLRKGLRA